MMKRAALVFCLLASTSLALPQGGTVTSGASTINQTGSTLNITQNTQNSVLNWQGFNIGNGETVNFYQPNSTALSINRISGNATQIEGALNANGRVWLLNPNGVIFGQGAQVNVGGLLATTASDVDANGNGTYQLGGINADSSVINNGTISAGQYAALAAASVQNNGHITAPNVSLVAAKGFALDDSGVLSIAPGLADFATRVTNAGTITAPGGKVQLMTQSTLQQAGLASVVNNSGVVEASGVNTDGGVITLTGDTVNQTGALNANGGQGDKGNGNGGIVTVYGNTYTNMAGSIEAKGGSQSGNGGNVEVSSKQGMSLTGSVDTTAAHGKTGTLTIDPDNIIITDGTGGANDNEVTDPDGTVNSGDGTGTDFTISEQALEALAATTDILLQATSNITVQPLTDHVLALATTGFEAGSNFSMDAADSISTGGATIHIQGANITVGALSGGAVTLDTTGGNITIGQGITTANAAITLNGNLVLPNDITLASGGGAISLNGNVTGAHVLSLNSSGGLTTLKNLDIGTLALSGGGALNLNGTITTDNALNLTGAGALTLAGDTTLNATDGTTRQSVTLGSANTVTGGGNNLTVTGANVALGGAATGLTSLNANANGTLNVVSVQTTGAQTYTGSGGITLNGNLTTGGGNVAVNNAAMLGADTTVATSGGNITFADSINGAHSLTATAGAGNVTLGGAVGATAKLTNVAASGAALALNGVQTTGAQAYTGPATIQGTFVNQTGTANFANNVTLAGTTLFSNNGTSGNLNFGGTVNGGSILTVNTGTGAATFTGDVGTGTALTAFNASGNTSVQNVTTSGLQTYSGNTTFNGTETAGTTLTLTGNTTLAGDTTLASTGNLGVGGTITGAHTLTLNANSADITLNTLTVPQLVLAGGNALNINGNLATTSGLDFTNVGAINLLTDATLTAGTTLQTDAANTFNGNGHSLTVDGTLLTLNAINNVNTLALNGSTGIALNGAVGTTGAQTYTGPLTLADNLTTAGGNVTFNNAVTLGADSTIATNNGNVIAHAAVDGGYNLTLTAGAGNVTADTDWGALTRLTTLTATGQTLTFQNINTTGNITLTGSVVSNRVLNTTNDIIIHGPITLDDDLIAGGSILLDGPITLTADSHVNTGGLVGNDLTISGDINGAHNLTLDAGLADIALTGNVDVNSLSFANAAQLTYGGGTLHTAQAFDFGTIPTIYLGGDTAIHAGTGSTGRANVTASANNTLLAGASNVDLSIFGDLVTLNEVGDNGSGRLQTLYVDASTVQLLGTIHTVGAQTIDATQGLAGLLISNGGDITLNTASTLLTDVTVQSNGGNVYFNKPVDGAHTLMVDAGGGDIYINAALGGGVPLSSFDATGRRIVLAGNLSVSDGLTLNVPVTLAADSTLDSLGSALILNGTIEGAHTLTVNASGGDITLAQGGHVAEYTQGSPSGNVTWGGSGLMVDGDVVAAQMNTLSGKLTTPGHAWLQANRGTNLALNVGSLYYAGGPARFSGTIGGNGGQRGAQRIQLGPVVAGPLTLNGMYSLPLPEIYLRAPAPFVAIPGSGDATGLYNVSLPPLLANNTVTVQE